MIRPRIKEYYNSNLVDTIKTAKCPYCSTIYCLNPLSIAYHQNQKCEHLKPGYHYSEKFKKRKKYTRKLK